MSRFVFLVTRSQPLARGFSSTAVKRQGVCKYPGARGAPFTSQLQIDAKWPIIPVYRVLEPDGSEDGDIPPNYKLPAGTELPFSKEQLVKMYEYMTLLHEIDTSFYSTQRTNRISFYMTNTGEEAVQIGSAAAYDPDDMIFAQYREAGVFLWRGFTVDQFANQCFANARDGGKGRQMPVHYGSSDLRIQTISSPLATQIPQASGAAYAYKRAKNGKIVVCYFGEGAASEGDFHPALNFAATLDCPVLFFCRNNGYAISTPSNEQYRGDGIASRGHGYGVPTIRVDGNDIVAVYQATKAAREYCLSNSRPVLLEAMCYRVGHHSSSDDSSRYRKAEEINFWKKHSPGARTKSLLESMSLWDDQKEFEHRRKCNAEVIAALHRAARVRKPPIKEMFTDVFDQLTPHLQEQRNELEALMRQYPEHFHPEKYESDSASS
jgi:2-oxoisovalerate dehydrogenase E1 component alpha subunit